MIDSIETPSTRLFFILNSYSLLIEELGNRKKYFKCRLPVGLPVTDITKANQPGSGELTRDQLRGRFFSLNY